MARNVIIADNHPMFRQGVKKTLEDSGLFTVVAEASDGQSSITKVKMMSPDILVLDLNMPGKNGFDVVEQIRKLKINTRIVVLSMHASEEFVSYAQSVGCSGFVAKEDASMELVSILSNESGIFLSSSSAGSQESELTLPNKIDDKNPNFIQQLSTSERKVLRCLTHAKTSPKIADELDISVRTVHAHRNNICKKLSLSGSNALLEFAVDHKQQILEILCEN